ncbi:uncharacterized protein [Patagioenas fasciata]|uniref:uncharacterized protein n=1 Tax=Patagioenas fasciata TaxID=372321 RepID=UPI003A993738
MVSDSTVSCGHVALKQMPLEKGAKLLNFKKVQPLRGEGFLKAKGSGSQVGLWRGQEQLLVTQRQSSERLLTRTQPEENKLHRFTDQRENEEKQREIIRQTDRQTDRTAPSRALELQRLAEAAPGWHGQPRGSGDRAHGHGPASRGTGTGWVTQGDARGLRQSPRVAAFSLLFAASRALALAKQVLISRISPFPLVLETPRSHSPEHVRVNPDLVQTIIKLNNNQYTGTIEAIALHAKYLVGLLIYPAVYGTDPALGFGVGPRWDAAAGVPGTAGLCQEKPPRFALSRGPRGGANPTRPRHPSPRRAGQTAGQTEGGTEGRRRRLPARGGGTTSPVKLRRPPAAAGLYKREWPGRCSRSISGRGGVGSGPLSPGHLRAPGRLLYGGHGDVPGGRGLIRAGGVGATCPDPRLGLWIWRMRRMLPGAPGVFRRRQPQRGERPARGSGMVRASNDLAHGGVGDVGPRPSPGVSSPAYVLRRKVKKGSQVRGAAVGVVQNGRDHGREKTHRAPLHSLFSPFIARGMKKTSGEPVCPTAHPRRTPSSSEAETGLARKPSSSSTFPFKQSGFQTQEKSGRDELLLWGATPWSMLMSESW